MWSLMVSHQSSRPTLLKPCYRWRHTLAKHMSLVPCLHHRACMFLQITADSTPEPSGRTLQAEAEPVRLPDVYGTRVTEEGLSIQTLQPPIPDAAQVAAGQIRRARAALAARSRQIHGPLPMPPRKQLQRPASAAPEQLTGVYLLIGFWLSECSRPCTHQNCFDSIA